MSLPAVARRRRQEEASIDRRGLASRALRWFDRNARTLPWRKNKSRYRVWISEIMLQQTQVAAVVPYFNRFISRFPSVRALASANESEVLRAWEGLGYYRRARHIHQAAQIMVSRHGGQCPGTIEQWRELPGIGRYTAGAILSISDDARLPIVEANTVRLFCRLLGERGDPRRTKTRARLWAFAESLLPRQRVGDLNQSLMEIGSQVCTPRNPRCNECPLRGFCTAFQQDRVEEFPRKLDTTRSTRIHQAAVVIRRGDRILMKRSGPRERWSGLWDVVRFERPQRLSGPEIARQIKMETGLRVTLHEEDFAFRFGVTRYAITLHCYQAANVTGKLRSPRASGWKWINVGTLDNLPLNMTARKIVRRLDLEQRSSRWKAKSKAPR
jgi:A/G-specific adenine glycosylase